VVSLSTKSTISSLNNITFKGIDRNGHEIGFKDGIESENISKISCHPACGELM
jgi:hypothetical protein